MTSQKVAKRRGAVFISVLMAMLTAVAVLVPSAGAVVVQVGPHQRAGVMPARGVNPASIRGSYAKPGAAKKFSANGNLDYNGGIVLHGEAPYLIFWDPSNQIAAADKALYERFFADSARDSGLATNVYSVDRQFTDSTGFANYSQTWDSSHAVTDTQAYPTAGQCTENFGYTETACLYDAQIQAEIARVIAADGLPSGETGQAPIYFVITPPTVNSCFSDNSTCADNVFCAYHSASSGQSFLYADMPTILDANDPKSCQTDNNSAVQEPNSRPIADVNIKAMSHEFNETITDPNGDAWLNNSASGSENGDNCNFYGSTVDPNNGYNPNAFTPTLGGSASLGTLFNQAMNGNDYYIQSEWSNGDINCKMKPTTSAISAAFSAPSTASQGASLSFDPTGSSSAAPYTSTTWNFGDGSSSFTRAAPAILTHAFSTGGAHLVTLTVVDKYGNLSTSSSSVTTPNSAFTASPSKPLPGSSVSFDGTTSSGAGSSIASYSWNFGDSSTGTGAAPSHAYAAAGNYTVTLTVTDGGGHTASSSHPLDVVDPPTAAFAVTTAKPGAGAPVAFDGSGSHEEGGSISSYSWNFGDGSAAGSGVTPSHVYATIGSYTVTLTVTDSNGHTNSVSHTVSVAGVPTAVITAGSATATAGQADSFSGSHSSDVGSSISSYHWSFGDGGAGTGQSVSHVYSHTGSFSVTLTVTDATGAAASTTTTVKVVSARITSVSVKTGKKVEKLTLIVSGPGTLRVGKRKFKIKLASSFVYKLKLSKAQRDRLRQHHSVKIKVTLKFQPTVGSSSTRTVSFKIKG